MRKARSAMQSARRAVKRAKPRKEETSDDSSEGDVDKALQKVEDNEETQLLGRTARDRERERMQHCVKGSGRQMTTESPLTNNCERP